ncbi:hypothetical protein GLOIN_2v1504917 [Rhizophagus irregularis DAOM 181602=DAOM 197198]|uniref:Uncharacterized protein n=1 Tax=Rhizophagus irregularis (strain DAOM 181602 / DAOM 197198 / MUCL 43194) TaxID=747089 RepID=U9TS69_RHIID|nr:hypothetical protein GLOIN_2v1504917 [Rhizophagus irregularis DAOM 181602=DAOM 197198]
MIMHPKWCSVTYIFTIMISFFFVFGEKNILIRVIMMIVRISKKRPSYIFKVNMLPELAGVWDFMDFTDIIFF